MLTAEPIITDADSAIDVAWFGEHSGRTCYARAAHDGWVLIVQQISQGRDQPPVLLRVWGREDRLPEDEASCLALWHRWAYPQSGKRVSSHQAVIGHAD
jgi:hypothetical protein